jgi:hypothetical protein
MPSEILSQVAQGQRPAVAQVRAALLEVEKAQRQTPQAISPQELQGTWRLTWASGARKTRRGLRLGQGYYLPLGIWAAITFDGTTQQIRNQLRLGFLEIQFNGPYRPHPKHNILVFDFTQVQVRLGEKILYQKSLGKYPEAEFATRAIAQLPFFVFLWASPQGIAARGRGGGLAIWVKPPGA